MQAFSGETEDGEYSLVNLLRFALTFRSVSFAAPVLAYTWQTLSNDPVTIRPHEKMAFIDRDGTRADDVVLLPAALRKPFDDSRMQAELGLDQTRAALPSFLEEPSLHHPDLVVLQSERIWRGDGRREVLGMDIGPSEAEPFWSAFLRKLTRRGLRGVKLVISDAHEGIKAAVSKLLCASFGGNENIRNQVAVFVGLLNNLAAEIDGAVMFLGHPNKAGQDFSGSTAWENQVRSRLFMEVPKDDEGAPLDPDARTLVRGKANYARNGEQIAFRWHKWAFVHEDDLPTDQREELAATIQANKDNEIFLRCLRELTRREQAVSENIASRTYAPLVFSKMPEAKGIGKARLEAAMDRLYRTDTIERGFLWRADRKDKYGLRERCADPRADPALTGCADPAMTTRRPVVHTHPLSHTPPI